MGVWLLQIIISIYVIMGVWLLLIIIRIHVVMGVWLLLIIITIHVVMGVWPNDCTFQMLTMVVLTGIHLPLSY